MNRLLVFCLIIAFYSCNSDTKKIAIQDSIVADTINNTASINSTKENHPPLKTFYFASGNNYNPLSFIYLINEEYCFINGDDKAHSYTYHPQEKVLKVEVEEGQFKIFKFLSGTETNRFIGDMGINHSQNAEKLYKVSDHLNKPFFSLVEYTIKIGDNLTYNAHNSPIFISLKLDDNETEFNQQLNKVLQEKKKTFTNFNIRLLDMIVLSIQNKIEFLESDSTNAKLILSSKSQYSYEDINRLWMVHLGQKESFSTFVKNIKPHYSNQDVNNDITILNYFIMYEKDAKVLEKDFEKLNESLDNEVIPLLRNQ